MSLMLLAPADLMEVARLRIQREKLSASLQNLAKQYALNVGLLSKLLRERIKFSPRIVRQLLGIELKSFTVWVPADALEGQQEVTVMVNRDQLALCPVSQRHFILIHPSMRYAPDVPERLKRMYRRSPDRARGAYAELRRQRMDQIVGGVHGVAA
jgi:hypothetical protein